MRGFLLFFLLLSIIGKSQEPVISCSFEKMNVVYIGIPNPVTIAASGYQCEELTVTGINCELTYKEPGKYDLITKGGTEAFVVVMAGGDTLGVEKYRIRRIPDPNKFFSRNWYDCRSCISGSFKANYDHYPYLDVEFKVVKVIFFYPDPITNEMLSIESVGDKLNEQAIAALNKTKIGQTICVEIYCIGPDNELRKVNVGCIELW
ncbi:MAG: hypothetical protein A2W91_04200 [Bacteroidetes bacterium GWF2_38_335]|nr:MAG: hypothetical protein A2W91_04200 [Bacteroidetes bacterium GWF2_38_335]OFY79152.1 MAG: hypothetical protein A2281_03535 [Bacteroidetes bacterium RIFOXYA12_FULL_38_20]HBS88760.1 hypothetical protein [Bacteroidales bacterium]